MEQIAQPYYKSCDTRADDRLRQVAKGGLLIILGVAILLRKIPETSYLMPDWLFGPHTLLMLLGLYNGVKHRFHNTAWLILGLVGVYLALRKYSDIGFHDLHFVGLPVAIVVVGIYIMFKRSRK
ncbi:hypothetical protein D3C72_552110 [compost metagenome]